MRPNLRNECAYTSFRQRTRRALTDGFNQQSLFVLYQEFAGPGLTGSCYCASDVDHAVLLAAAVDCSGADVVATYFHPDAAAASGLARRKETSDAAKRRQIETNTFCPPGLTPCRIPGASEGYEVRDPAFSFPLLHD